MEAGVAETWANSSCAPCSTPRPAGELIVKTSSISAKAGVVVKVLHVAEAYGGGVATAIQSYVLSSGVETEHFLLAYARPGHDIGTGRASFVDVREMGRGPWSQIRALRLAIADLKPGVVHFHSSFSGLLRPLVRNRSVKRVYSPHCFAFLRTDLRGGSATRKAVWWCERLLANFTDEFAVAGPYEGRLVAEIHPGSKIKMLPPADWDKKSIAEPKNEPSSVDICTLGRVCPQKDPKFFRGVVDALVLKGWSGTAYWIGGLKNQSEELEHPNIQCLGWLPREDVHSLMQASGVYVHSAAWEASVPYSVMEAAAAGLPVIARDIPPMRDRPVSALGGTPEEVAELVWHVITDAVAWRQAVRDAMSALDARYHQQQTASLRTLYESRL
ncbi:glycosyltransferase [Nocardioides sp. dk4132]|uniref:glycosyltransferase n=1 Tax=unclassified Nocardioides TaxID=2615069 RepID=UPI0012948C63|nr:MULTISPECIES: glycosyltransferase [unclassified Nocardioides]MQW78101.1 glycosyltransferase [Nocardioides sp. dk4132]QGA09073.1 glycosyltransferase [Nocardioides sp. dk884]